MDIKDELLNQAIQSILHGSIQTISSTDMNGNIQTQEVRVNDLRIPLIEKIAQKLVSTPEYKEMITRAFTPEIIKKLQEKALNNFSFNDLPWDVRQRIEREVKGLKIEVKKYKLVAEVIEQ